MRCAPRESKRGTSRRFRRRHRSGLGMGSPPARDCAFVTRTRVPVIAAGGVMTGAAVAAVIRAGAVAAQLGTALLRCPESGAVRDATRTRWRTLASPRRRSPGPSAGGGPGGSSTTSCEPTPMHRRPIRTSTTPPGPCGRRPLARRDPHATNLWAGQGFGLAQARPAGRDPRRHRRRIRRLANRRERRRTPPRHRRCTRGAGHLAPSHATLMGPTAHIAIPHVPTTGLARFGPVHLDGRIDPLTCPDVCTGQGLGFRLSKPFWSPWPTHSESSAATEPSQPKTTRDPRRSSTAEDARRSTTTRRHLGVRFLLTLVVLLPMLATGVLILSSANSAWKFRQSAQVVAKDATDLQVIANARAQMNSLEVPLSAVSYAAQIGISEPVLDTLLHPAVPFSKQLAQGTATIADFPTFSSTPILRADVAELQAMIPKVAAKTVSFNDVARVPHQDGERHRQRLVQATTTASRPTSPRGSRRGPSRSTSRPCARPIRPSWPGVTRSRVRSSSSRASGPRTPSRS